MTVQRPKVSVVTTIFNGESFFHRGTASILQQTFTDFEYIIVDDGSTDDTLLLLQNLAATDIRVKIFAPGRLGFAKALNYAIERAEGQYIARQDIDDISYPERLERQVLFLDNHPEVGLLGTHYILVDDNRGEKFRRMPPTDHEALKRALIKYIPFAHTTVMFRRAAWKEAGGYPLIESGVDLSLWIQIARHGWKLANLDECLGEHWVHQQSYWHQNFRYNQRVRISQRIQLLAVIRLGLPYWMLIYPLSRTLYASLPTPIKRLIRRKIAGSQEKDVDKLGT